MPCSRVAAGMSSGPFQLTNSPAAMVASTPDPPSCAGTRNAMYGVISDSVISTRGSRAQRRSRKLTQPTPIP